MNRPLFQPDFTKRRPLRRVPLRIIVPNVITLLALCLGMTAIRFGMEGKFNSAVLAILAAAVFDGLDGRIARALKGTSRFGAELDSLADFIDFGVAPALILYMWGVDQNKALGWFAALVFATACALRLARFNVSHDDTSQPAWASSFFTGMPAPAGALVVLLPLYLNLSALHWPVTRVNIGFDIIYMLLVAFLMVSRVPHFSGKTLGRVPREQVPLVLLLGATATLLLFTLPMETMILLTLVYFALIPLSIRKAGALRAAESEGEEAAEG